MRIRIVPFAEIAGAVSSATRLIACSHVSYISGKVLDVRPLVDTGVPVLLDAAQALGAIPVDMDGLGCAFYACSGQKWLCGPEGSGCLYVRADQLEQLLVPWPSFGSLADPEQALELAPAEGAARFDHGFPVGLRSEWALASLRVFAQAGWGWVHERALALAKRLAEQLAQRGLTVAPRGDSTLVSWSSPDAEADVARLAALGLVLRHIPGLGLVRASVGAWTSEEDVERLVTAAHE